MAFGPDDLFEIWKFQDNIHKFGKDLLTHGIKLGVYSMTIEVAKSLVEKGPEPLTDLDINAAKDRALQIAIREIEKRLDAGRSEATD